MSLSMLTRITYTTQEDTALNILESSGGFVSFKAVSHDALLIDGLKRLTRRGYVQFVNSSRRLGYELLNQWK